MFLTKFTNQYPFHASYPFNSFVSNFSFTKKTKKRPFITLRRIQHLRSTYYFFFAWRLSFPFFKWDFLFGGLVQRLCPTPFSSISFLLFHTKRKQDDTNAKGFWFQIYWNVFQKHPPSLTNVYELFWFRNTYNPYPQSLTTYITSDSVLWRNIFLFAGGAHIS